MDVHKKLASDKIEPWGETPFHIKKVSDFNLLQTIWVSPFGTNIAL